MSADAAEAGRGGPRRGGNGGGGNGGAHDDDEERATLLRANGGGIAPFSVEHPPSSRPAASIPSPLQSLDFEPVDNAVAAAEEANRSPFDALNAAAARWLVCFLAGACVAATSFAVNAAVELLAGVKFGRTLALLRSGHPALAFLLFAALNCALVGGAAALTALWAPEAAGSGIAEVKAFLQGVDVPGLFAARTLAAKLLGMVGAVSGGLAVGKEGPSLHAGAAIAALLSQGGSAARRSASLRRFWNGADRADIVACGAAAGIAAAFRAPLGGVLFALEGIATVRQRGNQLLGMAFFTTAVVSVSLRALMSACTAAALRSDDPHHAAARCGFFGAGGGNSGGGHGGLSLGGFFFYEIAEGQEAYELGELMPVVLLGVMGGLLGSLFNEAQMRLSRFRKLLFAPPPLLLPTPGDEQQGGASSSSSSAAAAAERERARRASARARVAEAVLVALLTSAASFALPLMARCRPCPSAAAGQSSSSQSSSSSSDALPTCPRPDGATSGSFVSLGCSAHDGAPPQYNDIASLSFNTADDAIRALFSPRVRHEYSVGSLAAFSLVYYTLSLYSYGLSLPTGLFVPSILCGAAYGRLVGIFVAERHPAARVDEGTYALLGAASLLGGSMRLVVAPCVMLLELTSNLALLPLVMMVLLIAKAVGDGTGVPGTYEVALDAKGLPYLPDLAEAGEWVAAVAGDDDDGADQAASSQQQQQQQGAAGGLAGLMRHVAAIEACGGRGGVVALRRVERVRRVVEVLATTGHSGFPVYHDYAEEEEEEEDEAEVRRRGRPGGGSGGKGPAAVAAATAAGARAPAASTPQKPDALYGLVLRSQLLVLLRARRCLQPSPRVHAEAAASVAFSFSPADFAAPMAAASPPPAPEVPAWDTPSAAARTCAEADGNGANGAGALPPFPDPYFRGARGDPALAAAALRLRPEDLDLWLDLGPYANRSPHSVPADAPLSKAYSLFRALGLRHLLVVSPRGGGNGGDGGAAGSAPPPPPVVGMLTRADLTPAAVEARLEETLRSNERAGAARRREAARARQSREMLRVVRARAAAAAGGGGASGSGGANAASAGASSLLPLQSFGSSGGGGAAGGSGHLVISDDEVVVGGGAGVTWVAGGGGRGGGGGGGGARRAGGGGGGGGANNANGGGGPLVFTAHTQPSSFFRPQRS